MMEHAMNINDCMYCLLDRSMISNKYKYAILSMYNNIRIATIINKYLMDALP